MLAVERVVPWIVEWSAHVLNRFEVGNMAGQLMNVAKASQRDTLESNSEKQCYGVEDHQAGPLGNDQLLGRTVFSLY